MVIIKEKKVKAVLRKILFLSPGWLQDLASFFYCHLCLPLSLGPVRYYRFYRFLDESQWWPREKLEQYQAEKLKQLLIHAYNHVPYYTDIFKKLHLVPEDFRSIKDLRKLPILTKEDIAKNYDKLISRIANKKNLELVWTSGSTGKPMQFHLEKEKVFMQYVFFERQANAMSVKTDDRRIKLWSRPFIEKDIKDVYLYEPLIKRLSLSIIPYSLNVWGQYIKLIKQFKPIFIQGNPSMLYNLACYAQERNIKGIKFRCFISHYENLFPYQRDLIQKQFQCEIFNYYGCEERVISAFECSAHQGMHIDMERGIVEITGENDEPLSEGSQGKILATGLDNYARPLIRYDIGDIGCISKEPCSCGRGLALLNSFDGRGNEVLKYKDKHVYSTTLSFLLWRLNNIKECQFIQENENEIKVNIVKRKEYSQNDTQELIMALRKIIDEQLNVSINFVDYIPRTKMGKFPFVISKIKPYG